MGQDDAEQVLRHRMHQQIAQEQGQPCPFTSSLRTQLPHESLIRTDRILFSRE